MRMCVKSLFSIISFGFIFLSPAQAAIVSYNFIAEQTFVAGTPASGSFAETAASFSEISGTIGYDTATPNVGFLGLNAYNTGSLSFNEFGLPGGGDYLTTNTNNFFGFDSLNLSYDVDNIAVDVNFLDNTQTLLSSAILPLFLTLTDPTASITILQGFSVVNFDITSLSAVPIPGALALFVTSLFGMALIRYRRKKSVA